MSGRSHGQQLAQVGREATSIADGVTPFPLDLDPEAAMALAKEVQDLRRRQLLTWLAKVFADFLGNQK